MFGTETKIGIPPSTVNPGSLPMRESIPVIKKPVSCAVAAGVMKPITVAVLTEPSVCLKNVTAFWGSASWPRLASKPAARESRPRVIEWKEVSLIPNQIETFSTRPSI
jgi:hypothetical protein